MELIHDLYKVRKQEYKIAGEILANAFSKKPMLKKLDIPINDIQNMFEMMVRYALRYGEIYSPSNNFEGIMIILPDKNSIMKTWQIIRSGAIFSALKAETFGVVFNDIPGKISPLVEIISLLDGLS